MDTSSHTGGLLRKALTANATFSAVSAIAFILGAGALAPIMFSEAGPLLGLMPSEHLFSTGLGLAPFAALVGFAAFRAPQYENLVKVIIAMDIGWVVGSVLLLAFAGSVFTTLGAAIIVDIALIVGLFAGLQTLGLRRLSYA